MALEGVSIGELDPDRTADFGTVAQAETAKRLRRQHARMYPQELTAMLSRQRNDPRSEALVLEEVEPAIIEANESRAKRGKLPDGFKLIPDSLAVRGEDGGIQAVTYTFRVKSGRTGKGALPYDAETFPRSFAAGTDAVAIAKAKEAGTAWVPPALAEQLARIGGAEGAPAAADSAEVEKLRRKLANAKAKIAELSESKGDGGDGGKGAGGASTSPDALEEPWDGYDGMRAQDIATRLREEKDPAAAQRVLEYEHAKGPRTTVTGAADRVLDTAPGG